MRIQFVLAAFIGTLLFIGCQSSNGPSDIGVIGLSLSSTTLRLYSGNSAKLAAIPAPGNATNPAVKWSSSNTAIADVDGVGKVTAIAPGSATITAASIENPAASAECAVTIWGIPIKALELGTAVDVSDLNDRTIYSMVAVEPPAKPEANGTPSSTFDGTLTTTAYVAPGAAAPGAAGGSVDGASIRPERLVFEANQVSCDDRMRQAENDALSSGSVQFSRVADFAEAAISVGSAWDGVKVIDFSVSGQPFVTINATCRAISAHAYFYVENGYESRVSTRLSAYAKAFEKIYLVNRAKFGEENDVDGNGKVKILFSHYLTGGVLGYFYSIDKFPTSTYANSNTSDIFYLTADSKYQGDYVLGTLAHEFQHMIYFDQHYNRSVASTYSWLNEALSQAAEYYNGYTANHLSWINYFLESNWQGLSLTHWTSSNYGYGAAFIRYLIDQYGDAAIKNMCSTANVGVAAVESATGEDFNAIFRNFARALVISGTGASSSKQYNFSTLDLQSVQPTGRGGLLPSSSSLVAGTTATLGYFPYRLVFIQGSGSFGTMTLSGSSYEGTAFGLAE